MLTSPASTAPRPLAQDAGARIPFLDGWRALAVIIVIVDHCYNALVAELDFPLARVGVHIFFAISAFIITHLSLREIATTGAFNVRNFFLRRALRILPPLALLLIVVVITSYDNLSAQLPAVARAALFTCNIDISSLPGCTWEVGHTWSLAFEEQFYLLFPFVLLKRFRLIVIPFIAFYLLPLFLPVGYVGKAGHLQITMLFALGMLYARNKAAWDERLRALPWPVYVAAPLVAMGWMLAPDNIFRDTLFFVEPPAVFLLVFGATAKFPMLSKALGWRPLVTVGLWSYSIYLWQELFTRADPNVTWFKVGLGVAFAVVISWASYRWFEAPFRRMSRRLAPGASPALAPTPALSPGATTG